MKDEEMAKEYSKSACAWIEDREPLDEKDIQQAFLAGLKTGRPQWHKVADGDLPKADNDMLMSGHLILLTKLKGTDDLYVTLGRYNFSTQEFCYQHIIGLIDVVAWCEIPTFDKE